MAQIFDRKADKRLRAAGWSLLGLALAGFAFLLLAGNHPSRHGVGEAPEQPMPFSHARHVGELGLDCATCHAGADDGRHAGMPANETCLTCHDELFRGTRSLQPLWDAVEQDRPVEWNAVNRLGNDARFHHGAHAQAGIPCATCHGPVETMQEVAKTETLSMDWCVDCHREVQLPEADRTLKRAKGVSPHGDWTRDLTDCSVCHY